MFRFSLIVVCLLAILAFWPPNRAQAAFSLSESTGAYASNAGFSLSESTNPAAFNIADDGTSDIVADAQNLNTRVPALSAAEQLRLNRQSTVSTSGCNASGSSGCNSGCSSSRRSLFGRR